MDHRPITQFISLSRARWSPLEPAAVDLGALAREVAGELKEGNPGRRIAWNIGPLPPVVADADLLRIALQELCGNACKFTRDRSVACIRINATRGEGETILSVSDNGIGFDPESRAIPFRLFHRLRAASSFEGAGTGLAIVRSIIERHGGRIWAEGSPDLGARFSFSIPDSPARPLRSDPLGLGFAAMIAA